MAKLYYKKITSGRYSAHQMKVGQLNDVTRKMERRSSRHCWKAVSMDSKAYQELIELIEGQRSIINRRQYIRTYLIQCAEQENMIMN